jgi:hypothetical protein
LSDFRPQNLSKIRQLGRARTQRTAKSARGGT